MSCNNGLFCGSGCNWLLILVIIYLLAQKNDCGSCAQPSSFDYGCGCGCN